MVRGITLRGAVALNVITMIGIGPLITIPLVLANLAGPLALTGWIAGAIVALCDGLVWAELAARYPGSGGTYVYLREIFGRDGWGRMFAFLFNWQYFLSASLVIATGYIGFADYAGYLFPQLLRSTALNHAVAVAVGLVTVALLYRRITAIARFGALLACVAILTLVLVGVAGLTHADFHRAFAVALPFRFGWGFVAGFGSALYITLYDYAGYSEIALVGEEVREPRRTIPYGIVLSILLVLALYLFLQIGVLSDLPWQSAAREPAAAQFVASAVVAGAWGKGAAVFVTCLILVTAFASVYGGLLGASRVPFAAARDGAFLPTFARLHPFGQFPNVSLLCMGAISIVACFFDLGTVIAIVSSAGILIGSIGQIIALFVLRMRREPMPFRMWLFPLPAVVALAGWILAYAYTGGLALAIGVGWLALGVVLFLGLARVRRWWPFAIATLLLVALGPRAASAQPVGAWQTWRTSRVTSAGGNSVFLVENQPFFVYGASFFYERTPRDEWEATLRAYRDRLHVNTIDLYVPWNWHEPAEGELDFTGRTNPRRDLLGVLRILDSLGLKIVLRPGPVIRNEWRNGGYPDWLLERPEYGMPLHDVLDGRYPATATLQNAHADAAAAEWLRNATHLRFAAQWLRDALTAVAPYSRDVIAIALDDDQGAYPDNDTWPAPHWHAYVNWLRATVRAVTGARVPIFVNTWQMKVTADAPVWAWGNWYQSDAFSIGEHDREQLEFSTDLLGTQRSGPIMISEFQAGWLQGADEGATRPADPTNTALALGELLADGAHGIVNFPVQDTIYPAGWEAPWANWAYDWDAAFTTCGVACPRGFASTSARFAPTAEFGAIVRRFGTQLASAHRIVDAAIVWPPSLFSPRTQNARAVAREADATIAMLRDCHDRGLSCTLADLRYGTIPSTKVVLPVVISDSELAEPVRAIVRRLRAHHRIVPSLAGIEPSVRGGRGETSLACDPNGPRCFLLIANWSEHTALCGPYRIAVGTAGLRVAVLRQTLAARSVRLLPLPLGAVFDVSGQTSASARTQAFNETAFGGALFAPAPAQSVTAHDADVFRDGFGSVVLSNRSLSVIVVPDAGARLLAAFSSTIGLLRDAVDPEPTPSSRDYIAPGTHPIPAGTFNRPYDCAIERAGPPVASVTCRYDAPDLPERGARFERRLSLTQNRNRVDIQERMTPHDSTSQARLKSISGFSLKADDVVLAPKPHDTCFGVYSPASERLVRLCWRAFDVSATDVRETRAAAILTLHFRRNDVAMALSLARAHSESEARSLMRDSGL